MKEEKADTVGQDHREAEEIDHTTEKKEGLLARNLIPNQIQIVIVVQNLIKSLIQIDIIIKSLVL